MAWCDLQTEDDARRLVRLSSGLTDLDYHLGGTTWATEQGFQSHWGFVRPSVVALAGADGAGRTTLMLQVAANVARSARVLYVSGSQSAYELGLHAERVGARQVVQRDVFVSPSANLADVDQQLVDVAPVMLVLDSMRTMQVPEEADYGSDRHLEQVARFASKVSKKHNLCVVLVTSKEPGGDILLPEPAYALMDVILVLHKRMKPGSELEWQPNNSPMYCLMNRYGR